MGPLVIDVTSLARIDWDDTWSTGEYVAQVPCCRAEVRLDVAKAEPDVATAILCDQPECHKIWAVEFLDGRTDTEAVAVWRLLMTRQEQA